MLTARLEEEPTPSTHPSSPTRDMNAKRNSLLRTMRQWIANTLRPHGGHSLEESVAELIEEHAAEGTVISSEERLMLRNILSFGELKVEDIMIPRTDIVAVDSALSLSALVQVFIQETHTRMPVYQGSLDHVIGFIHIKDILPALQRSAELEIEETPFQIQDVLREVLFVPPSVRLVDLLVKMQGSRVHMAVVLDEYGGVDGLVTIEDLVEEIVGEIEDEHDDSTSAEVKQLSEHAFEISGRLPIEKLESLLNITIFEEEEETDFDTVGGLILSLVGHVPVTGEIISYGETLEFEVLDASPRCVKRLLVRKKNFLAREEQ